MKRLGTELRLKRLTQSTCAGCDAQGAFLRSSRPPYEALRPRVRLVDIFAGCGGLSLGVAEAAHQLDLGIDVRLAIDMDEDAVAVYKANFPGGNVQQVLVEDLFNGKCGGAFTTVEKRVAKEVGEVDVLVGGPPCQGHSDLNNHTRRNDPRNALYSRMARAAEVLQPTLVLIENVPRVMRDVAKVVDATTRALSTAGYDVCETVLDLGHLGVPQRRRRHVVLASRRSEVDPKSILSDLESPCLDHLPRSSRWAIVDLLNVEPVRLLDTPSKQSRDNAKRIGWLFKRGEYDLPNSRRPDCHKSDHTYKSMYGRLRWREPAQTVTTGFGSMGQGRYVHPSRRRTLTPHEAARLQMLPDFWDFQMVRSRGALALLSQRRRGNELSPSMTASKTAGKAWAGAPTYAT